MIDARVKTAHLQAAQFLAARKAKHLDFTMTAPVTDPPADPPKNDPPAKVEAVDDEGNKLGFPKDTPVDDMTDAEAKRYWRNQSKKHQKALPKNLSELQEKAGKWDAHEKTQKTPEQQQSEAQQRDAEARIKREAAEDAAKTLLEAILAERGKKTEEVDDLLDTLNMSKLLTDDGKLDRTKVRTLADKLAPTGSGGGYGQGRYEQTPQDKAEAGRAEAKRRSGAQDQNTSRYGSLSRR